MRTSWRIELPQLLIVLALFVWAALLWPSVPEQIPVHWDTAGNVDRYGGRFEALLIVPLVALGTYVLLRYLPLLDPARANYRLFRSAFAAIRIGIMAFFAVAGAVVFLAAAGRPVDTPAVIELGLGLLFIVLGSVMGKIRPNWFVGIRTPWTLTSKTSWVRTHRMGGFLFVAIGLGFVIATAFRGALALTAIIVFALAGTFALLAYSYVVWRSDPHRSLALTSRPAEDEA